jgi:hypothetical protein
MLCQVCHAIFRNSYPSKESEHYFFIHELQRAALGDCCICRVLWYGVSDLPQDNPETTVDAPNTKEATNTKPVSKHVIRHKPGRGKGILEIHFVVDRNGVDNGGRAFSFCMQAKSGKSG